MKCEMCGQNFLDVYVEGFLYVLNKRTASKGHRAYSGIPYKVCGPTCFGQFWESKGDAILAFSDIDTSDDTEVEE